MNSSEFCIRCGSAVPGDGRSREYCPGCLLRLGLEDDSGVHETRAGRSRERAPAAAELAPLFPRLELQEPLGQGGMGWVYRAHQLDLDRTVAVKVLPADRHGDDSFRERFRREARALARLSHNHVVQVYDTGEAGGYVYLVMEHVDGLNLRQIMQEGPVPPRDALALVDQICTALEYAHSQGVVHRDIKPENVLVDRAGTVKIADFGLARLLGPLEGAAFLTASNQVVGTPHYMAPEQWERPRDVDQRADLYGLGVILYELLTGELPLGRFELPSRRAGVDERLDAIVLRALEKDPARRYQGAGELRADVARLSASALRTPAPRGAAHAARRSEAVTAALRPDGGRRAHLWLVLQWIAAAVTLIVPVSAGLTPVTLWVCLSIGGVLPAVGMVRHLGRPLAWSYLAVFLAWWSMALLAVALVPRVALELEYTLYGDPTQALTGAWQSLYPKNARSLENLRMICLSMFGALMILAASLAVVVKLRPLDRLLESWRRR